MISSEAFGKVIGILLKEIYPSQIPEDAARTGTRLISAAAQLLNFPSDATVGDLIPSFSLNFRDFSIRLRKVLTHNSSVLLSLGNLSDLYSALGYVEESLLLICTLFRCEATVSTSSRAFSPRIRPAESSEPTKHLFVLLRTTLPALLVQYRRINVYKTLTNYENDQCSPTDDPNHRDKLNTIFAVFSKSLGIVLAVLKEEGKQADQDVTGIDAVDCYGRTPLSYALERGVGLTALFAPPNDRWNSIDDAPSVTPCDFLTPLGGAFISDVITLLLQEGDASPTKDVHWAPSQPRRERFAGRVPSGATSLPYSSSAATNQLELADEEEHEGQKDEFVEWCGSQKSESFPSKEFASNLGISPLMYLYLLSGQISAALAIETPTKIKCGSPTTNIHTGISALLVTISNLLITFGANAGEARGVSIDIARKLAMSAFRPLLVDLAGNCINSDHPAFQEVSHCRIMGFGSEPVEPLLISALRLTAIFETLLQNASRGVFPCSALLDALIHKSDLTKPYLVHAGINQNVVSTRYRQQHPIGYNALLVAVNASLATDHVKSLLNQLERNAHILEAEPFSSTQIDEKRVGQNILHVALHRLTIILETMNGTHLSSSLRASLDKCCEIVRWVIIDFADMCVDDQGPLPSLYRLFGPRFFDDEGPDGRTPLAIVAELLFLISDNQLQLKIESHNSVMHFFTTVFIKLIDFHGANVNFINPLTGDSILHTAIKKNNQIVFELLTGDYNPRDDPMRTQHGDSDFPSKIKADSRWLDLAAEDRNGMTVLNIAVARRDLNSARQLLHRESLQIRSSRALESGAQHDHNQFDDNPLQVVLLPTFDPHKPHLSSRTRLQNANKRVRDESILAEAGTFSPLLTACYLNDLDMVQLLLSKSRNIEEHDLILSADPNKFGFVDESSSESFFGMGVVKRKNRSLTTALRVALIPDHDDSIRGSENYNRVRFEIAHHLLECGADPNESSFQNEILELRGVSPVHLRAPFLHELSQRGLFLELATVLRLSQTHIDVNTKSVYAESKQYGMTALHCVVTEAGTHHTAQKQIVCDLEKAIYFIASSLLAKNTESVSCASGDGHQVFPRLIACAGLLIFYGADVNSIDVEELSVLERAVVSLEAPANCSDEKVPVNSQSDAAPAEDYRHDLINDLRKSEAPHSFLRFLECILNLRDECCSCVSSATKSIHQASVGFQDRQSISMCVLSLALMSAGATTNISRRVPLNNPSTLPTGTRPLPTIASRPLVMPRLRHATLSAQRLINSSILIVSIEKEAFLIVEALLGYRPVCAPATLDLNAADTETGFTALHAAIWRRKVAAEKKRDIDVEFCSVLQDGKEANKQCSLGESDEMLRIVRMLLAANPSLESRSQRLDTRKKDSEGRTTIHLASALGHYTIVELLLAKMDVENPDTGNTTLLDQISGNCKTTLLHIAVEKRSLNMMRAFLVRGAPIDVKRHNDGHTPISLASARLFSVFNSNSVGIRTPLTKEANYGGTNLPQVLGRGGTATRDHSSRLNPTSEYAYFSQFRNIKTHFSDEDCKEVAYYLSIIQDIQAAFSKGSFCEEKSKSLAACAIPVAYTLLSPLHTAYTVRRMCCANQNPADHQQNEIEKDCLSVQFIVNLVRCLTRFEHTNGAVSHELLHHLSFIIAFKCVSGNQIALSAFDVPLIVDNLVVPLVRSLSGQKSDTFSKWSPLHALAFALRFSTPQTLGAESRAVDTQVPEPPMDSPFDSLNRLIDALLEHDTKNTPQSREIRPPAGHPSPIHIIAESLVHFITECGQEENRTHEKYRLSLSGMCDNSAKISENVYTQTKDIYSLALNKISESETLSMWGGVDATTPLGTTASQIVCSAHIPGVGELADSVLSKVFQKCFFLPLLQRSFLRTLFSVGRFEGKAQETRHPVAFTAANPNFSDEHRRTLLFMACADGNENVALFLLKEAGADPNFQPICRAPTTRPMPNVSHSQVNARKIISNEGCVRDSLKPKMITPLHAAVERASPSIVKELLFHGADPNIPSTDGRQPLNIAAEANNMRICQILLGEASETQSQYRTANPNASYYNGMVPLQAASKYHNIEMAQLLIEKGACVNMRPNPNWVIRDPKRADPRTTQEPSQTCSFPQRTGANANLLGKSTLLKRMDATNDEMKPQIPEADRTSLPSRLSELPTIQSGTSPLHYACSPCAVYKAGPRQSLNFSLGLIALLLNSGADATATDELGRTPLHLLAGMCRWENKHTRRHRRDHVNDDEQRESLSGNSPSPRILALLLAASEIITRDRTTVDAEDYHGRTPLMSCLLVGRRYDGYNEFSYSRLDSKIQPHLVPQDVHQWQNDDEEEQDDEDDMVLIQKDLDTASLQRIGGPLFHCAQLRIFVTNSSGLAFVKLLLINGANPNTPTLEGCLPLTLAVERHREGTTPEEKSKAASTPSNTTTVLGARCPAGWSEDDQLILALLASGADSSLPDRAADKRGPGASALQIAVQRCRRYGSQRENLLGGGEWQTLLLSELDFFDFGISRTRAWREVRLNSASREPQPSDNLVDCDDSNETKSLRDSCGLPPSFAPRSLLAVIEQRETSDHDRRAVSDSFYPIFFAPFLKKFFFTYALSGGLLLRLLVENGSNAGHDGRTSPALLTAIRLSESFDHDAVGSDEDQDNESEGRTWDREEILVRSLILSVAAGICGYLMSIGVEIGRDLPAKDALEKAPSFLSDLIKSEFGL